MFFILFLVFLSLQTCPLSSPIFLLASIPSMVPSTSVWLCDRGLQRDVVYLGWPRAPLVYIWEQMQGGGDLRGGVSANEDSCAHGAQINFRDRTPYLKGQCHKIFDFRFLLGSVPPEPLIIPLRTFQIFSKSMRYSQLKVERPEPLTPMANGKKSTFRKVFIISFGHLLVVELALDTVHLTYGKSISWSEGEI
jgi:hypothetical protein